MGVARILKEHWSKIFLANGIDMVKLKVWLEEDRQRRTEDEFAPFSEELARQKPIAAAARKRLSISPYLERYWTSSTTALDIEMIILLQQQWGIALKGVSELFASEFTTVH